MVAQPYHHGDLRRALLDEAYVVLRKRGAAEVSLRSLATSVGVSPSAAYHHFPDKDELLIAVGERGNEEFDRRMAAAAASVTGDSDAAAAQRFIALGRAYVLFAMEEPHLFSHEFSELCAQRIGPPAARSGGEGEAGAFTLLLASLDELDRRGLLQPGIRPGLEMQAWASVHGFAELARLGWMPREALDDFLDSVARLVLTPKARSALRRRAARAH